MSGSLEGIGAVLREKDHLIEIVEIVPGGASWRQGGLAAGRPILSASQQEKQDPGRRVRHAHRRGREDDPRPEGHGRPPARPEADRHRGDVAITRDVVVIEDTYAQGARSSSRRASRRTATSTCRASTAASGSPRTSARRRQDAARRAEGEEGRRRHPRHPQQRRRPAQRRDRHHRPR